MSGQIKKFKNKKKSMFVSINNNKEILILLIIDLKKITKKKVKILIKIEKIGFSNN